MGAVEKGKLLKEYNSDAGAVAAVCALSMHILQENITIQEQSMAEPRGEITTSSQKILVLI